jgi:hypothetical protein
LTDAFGNYSISILQPGNYYVWALSDDHVDEVYPQIECEASGYIGISPHANCDVATAVQATLAPGMPVPPFNFALHRSAAMYGVTRTRVGTGSSLPADANVYLYDSHGALIRSTGADASGAYAFDGLVPGTYFAAAGTKQQPTAIYSLQLWDHIDCISSCTITSGAPIVIGYGATQSGIDFQLDLLSGIVGRVSNSNGNPIGGAVIDVFDSTTLAHAAYGIADANGYFAVPVSLGYAYDVATDVAAPYQNAVFSGIACPLGAAYYGLCSFAGAQSVNVEFPPTQPHIVNFTLTLRNPIFANGFE